MTWVVMILLTIFNVVLVVAMGLIYTKRKEIVYTELKNKDVLLALGYFLAREEALTEEHLRQLRRSLYKIEQAGVDVQRFRNLAKKNYKLDIEGK